ncbi:hypothetical protein GE21DRAFT_838 [Neurospora crassa]|uniref:Uncharacterized protein n=1 Tax=Neurospora crassa (strain ATCC 24698 / 74-OR23-1A / CBS 708.71 / DSM 1257 / FGSC 987) TaxID=367110 RepID=Q7S015_NEUCR|nr:hypothetical protein NCU10076 [Neurospora crassa OR74A]EAA28632.3 hypothetical protein NCU10076 [Neurospora crassa OR74A]KHE90088.1 hypothetical protein GE21DRAFT_838 [Neurospora crassa]|eukprot:XP_957868.3 hypothetical protein NCU10076 [Neurospora crassa OR74A]
MVLWPMEDPEFPKIAKLHRSKDGGRARHKKAMPTIYTQMLAANAAGRGDVVSRPGTRITTSGNIAEREAKVKKDRVGVSPSQVSMGEVNSHGLPIQTVGTAPSQSQGVGHTLVRPGLYSL